MIHRQSFVAGCLLLGLIGGTAFADPPPNADPASRAEYAIGIEDVLNVTVWNEGELSKTVKVRPDGRITLPLVNDILVEGLTTQELRNQITRRLEKFVRDPNVSVILDESNSFKIYVLGEVNTQGVQKFYRPPRLLQALATAGGLTQFSSKQITIFREVDGDERRIEINYKKLVSGEGTDANIYLIPGDTLVVK